jgi:anti-sigma regulatory factor (Ser/Thr protein kinase)
MRVRVGDPTAVGSARRAASELGRSVGLDETALGRAALVVTEAATNLVKHAGGGEILLRPLRHGPACGLEVLALDRGPGIPDVAASLRDGVSTAGTPGTGLGAMSRLSSVFDVYPEAGVGTAVLARVWSGPTPPTNGGLLVGGVAVPHPSEEVCGDAWAVWDGGLRTQVLVVDGLGHGVGAADASAAAVATFRLHAGEPPADLLAAMHGALRPTRGAAVGIAEIDRAGGVVRFAGVGNVAGAIVTNGTARSVVSHHGTLGHGVRRIHEFTYPWSPGALLVLHSDGLVSHWTLERYAGLVRHDPALVAAVLYRDFQRGRDDTTVVALREAA